MTRYICLVLLLLVVVVVWLVCLRVRVVGGGRSARGLCLWEGREGEREGGVSCVAEGTNRGLRWLGMKSSFH